MRRLSRNMDMKESPLKKPSRRAFFTAAACGLAVFSSVWGQQPENIIFHPEKVKTIPGHGMSKAEYPFDPGGKYQKEWVDPKAKSKERSSVTVRNPIPADSKEHTNYLIAQAEEAEARKKAEEARKRAEEARRKELEKKRQAPRPDPKRVAQNPYAPVPRRNDVPQARVVSDYSGYIGPYRQMELASLERRPASSDASQFRTAAPRPAQAYQAGVLYHKVDVGDTLYNISRKYGISIDALKRANGLKSDLIRVGQSLRLALAQHTLGLPRG